MLNNTNILCHFLTNVFAVVIYIYSFSWRFYPKRLSN